MEPKPRSDVRSQSREQPSTISYASLHALRLKLGQILLDAQLLKPDELQEALKIAKESDEPVGRVLITLSYVTEQTLQAALLAQSLIAEGVCDQPAAIEALKISVAQKIPLQQALEQAEVARAEADSSELDELLIESRMIQHDVYTEAKRVCRDNKIPIGRALVVRNAITFKNLSSALECVALMRNGRITKEEALKVLSEIREHSLDMEEALRRAHLSPRSTLSKLKLGEMLTAGKFINERQNLAAVERALLEKRLLGDVLIESGLVSRELLQAALTVQNLAARGVITHEEAVKALRKVTDEKKTFTLVAEELRLFKDDPDSAQQILDLLYKAGLARPDDVPVAVKQQQMLNMDALKALLASGCISDLTYQAAVDCWSMVKAGELSAEQSIIALQSADRNRSSLIETLQDMGLGSKIKLSHVASPMVASEIEEEPELEEMPPPAQWFSFIEGKLLITNFILGGLGLLIVFKLLPEDSQIFGVCTIIFLVMISQFALGKMWEKKVDDRKKAKQERLENAKLTVNRLSNKRK